MKPQSRFGIFSVPRFSVAVARRLERGLLAVRGIAHKLALAGVAVWLTTGCAAGVVGGKPRLPLSGKGGSHRVLQASAPATISAITNAFANFQYRGMALYDAGRWRDVLPRQPTSGFLLCPLDLNGITNIPVGHASATYVPYVPYFHIYATPVGENQTKVTVSTIRAEVIDGHQFGWHGGRAIHYRKVPPVRQEEENVLAAIAQQLASQTNDRRPQRGP